MIIDLILDKRAANDNKPLTAAAIRYLLDECEIFGFSYIYQAAYNRNNRALKNALCEYIDNNEYNPEIKDFIVKTTWF